MKVHYLQVGGGSQIGRPAKGGGRDFVGVLGNFNFWVKNIARVVRGVLKFIYINTTFREGSEFTGWGRHITGILINLANHLINGSFLHNILFGP